VLFTLKIITYLLTIEDLHQKQSEKSVIHFVMNNKNSKEEIATNNIKRDFKKKKRIK